MALLTGKPIRQVAPPALPQSPREYTPFWQDQYNNVLRLYFNQLNNVSNALISQESGGAAVFNPHATYRSLEDQNLDAVDTATPVSFGNPFAEYEILGISINGVDNTNITVDYSGVYQIAVNLQVQSTTAVSKNITVWLRKDGTDVDNSARRTNFQKAGNDTLSYVIAVELNAGSVLQVVWASTSINARLNFIAASSPYPAIPSAIISVTHESNVLLE